jgi:hypothetical protein
LAGWAAVDLVVGNGVESKGMSEAELREPDGPITPPLRTAREWADVKGILIMDNDGGLTHRQLYSEAEFDERARKCTIKAIKRYV